VARLARISIATASGLASALRAAGLIATVRDGRTVLHRQTPLGALLTTTNGAPPPPAD
jgi:DNA-binding transcriptional ArsR family regulator